MLINCDLGERPGGETTELDEHVMAHIDQASIACGFHAGDPLTIRRTLSLAARHGVTVGAHPAYPDPEGFGRRSIRMSVEELHSSVLYQVSALDGMARSQGLEMSYVKPHGALYNDMMVDREIRATVMAAIADFHKPLALMIQATAEAGSHRREAEALRLPLLLEAFADRCYDDDGRLLSRSRPGAVHSRERMLKQVQQLCDRGTVTTVGGRELKLEADTLCVHGDNHEGVQSIRAIRLLIEGASRG